MSQAKTKIAVIMAGGTGGHIFPGLAIAKALQTHGWQVTWLGGTGTANKPSMESRLIPAQNIPFEAIAFGGLRGKGLLAIALLPMRLLKAFWDSIVVLRRVKPQVVIGMGGYISFPAGMMAVLLGKKLVLHEQNSVAGLANKVLAGVADKVYTAFPNVLSKSTFIGNPLRAPFLQQAAPAARFAGRTGALRVLVVGGSLGAKGLNDCVPKAIALLPAEKRPIVLHQSGESQLADLERNYTAAGVLAQCTAFIEDTATAFAEADLIIARAGASTVTEIAAVGAAALFVPFPFAVDDHQTTNAQYLVQAGGGWLEQQSALPPEKLAAFINQLTRQELQNRAEAAHTLAMTQATETIVNACEEFNA